jgi:anaerobic selenocysteine-containing dehydrogenase
VEQVAPSHAGITRALLADRRFRDGITAPLDRPPPAPTGPEPEAHTDISSGATTDVPGAIDPMADPGIDAVETQGVPATAVVPEPVDDVVATVTSADSAPPARPRPLTFSGDVPTPPLPPLDAYSLRLVSRRSLYGNGTLVQAAPALAALAKPPCARANPSDLDRLGIRKGGQVRVRSNRANFLIEAEPDAGVPRGSLSLAFNSVDQTGEGAGALIDADAAVTDVRVETP